MSGPVGSQQWMYSSSSGFYPHEIGNSARFDTNSSLTRTPSSTSNRKTWTWSAWLKISSFDGYHTPFSFGDNSTGGTDVGTFFRLSADQLEFSEAHGGVNSFALISNQLFRDPSAWYHFVFSVDTTQSTSSNRIKIYVNGSQITSFSRQNYPSQNFDTSANQSGLPQCIGALDLDATVLSQFYDGYISEVNFVDGQALDASYFGEFKSDVWIPKRYSGSYGTNGFHLDFGNSGSLGADVSGNGNNWTSTNLATTDQMLDSPTNNFATLNPLGPRRYGANHGTGTQTQGNLTVASTSQSYFDDTSSTIYVADQKKWYYEIRMDQLDMGASTGYVQFNIGGAYLRMWYGASSNTQIISGSTYNYSAMSNGDILMFAVDEDNEKGWFGLNGTWYTTSGTPDPAAGTGESTTSGTGMIGRVQIRSGTGTNIVTANFGQDSSFAGQATAQGNTDANGIGDFYYAPPAGFLALCTANMPDPAAVFDPALDASPQDHFNPVLYTGNSSTQSITGVGFQPDLVWTKSRSSAGNHGLHDIMRLTGSVPHILYSDLTNAEPSASGGGLVSFASDGFNLNNNNVSNTSGVTYAAWNWKAGGTGVSNTDGTLASQVSANTDAGFSVVTFTTDGSNNNVGTGLSSSKPLDMLIIKRRDSTSDWQVGHRFSGQSSNFAFHTELNSDSALSGIAPYFMGSQSTSNGDRLYLGAGASGVSSATWVAYCFQSVEGFSKFGKYTGNGDADGPFIYTGFRPAFVITKRTDGTSNWTLWDTTRDPYNAGQRTLMPNDSGAEESGNASESWDILSNGLKLRSYGRANVPSGTYIYMAFAEMPFKYANAR